MFLAKRMVKNNMPMPQEKGKYTFTDYLSWDENERIEIIHGEAIIAQAAPSPVHQEVAYQIARQIGNYLEGKRCKVYPAPFAVCLDYGKSDDEADTVVEPDISIVCDMSKINEHGCKGAPDMIAEVVSPSTARRDRMVKLNLYEQAGVREYWIVDPLEQSIQVYLLDTGRYRIADYYAKEDIAKVHVLDGCFVELSKVFK